MEKKEITATAAWTIRTKELRLKKVGKTSIFEHDGSNYFASSRVANDIINNTFSEVFVQDVVRPDGHSLGLWLATPSRFN